MHKWQHTTTLYSLADVGSYVDDGEMMPYYCPDATLMQLPNAQWTKRCIRWFHPGLLAGASTLVSCQQCLAGTYGTGPGWHIFYFNILLSSCVHTPERPSNLQGTQKVVIMYLRCVIIKNSESSTCAHYPMIYHFLKMMLQNHICCNYSVKVVWKGNPLHYMVRWNTVWLFSSFDSMSPDKLNLSQDSSKHNLSQAQKKLRPSLYQLGLI